MSTQALSLLPGGCAVLRAADPDDGGSPPLSPLPGAWLEAGPRAELTLTLFDTWPRALWHAGRLLVGDGKKLYLMDASRPGEPLAALDGAAPPRFAWELPEGPLAGAIGPLLELRALDGEVELRVDQRWWWLRNEDDKIGKEAALALKASVENGCSWGFMHSKLNQYVPFEFKGYDDDPKVYDAFKDVTGK